MYINFLYDHDVFFFYLQVTVDKIKISCHHDDIKA
jgi:hypothetical protein